MTGKEKLEKLIHGWYGFAVFGGLATVLMNGIGIFSILLAAISTFVMLCVTFVIGRLLMNRSSVTRVILVVLSALGACLFVLAVGTSVWSFFGEWSFSLLAYGTYAAAGAYMHGRSFSVLTDKSVKAHFA